MLLLDLPYLMNLPDFSELLNLYASHILTICVVSHKIGLVLSGFKNGPVVDWLKDTTTTIVNNINLLHFH